MTDGQQPDKSMAFGSQTNTGVIVGCVRDPYSTMSPLTVLRPSRNVDDRRTYAITWAFNQD